MPLLQAPSHGVVGFPPLKSPALRSAAAGLNILKHHPVHRQPIDRSSQPGLDDGAQLAPERFDAAERSTTHWTKIAHDGRVVMLDPWLCGPPRPRRVALPLFVELSLSPASALWRRETSHDRLAWPLICPLPPVPLGASRTVAQPAGNIPPTGDLAPWHWHAACSRL